MMSSRNHVSMHASLRGEAGLFVRYMARIGAGVGALAVAIIAIGSLQSADTAVGLQVGHAQFGESSYGNALDAAGDVTRVGLLDAEIAGGAGATSVAASAALDDVAFRVDVYDDVSGAFIARL